MAKYHWDVEVPKDGVAVTREQAWAVLAKLSSSLSTALYKVGDSLLTEEEKDDLHAVRAHLQQLTDVLGRDPLDALAEIKKPKYKNDPQTNKFPDEIRTILHDWHGELYRFKKRDGDQIELALAMLDDAGFSNDEIGNIIRDHMNPDYKHGDVWSCPRCDQCGEVAGETCNRCYGWGFVLGDEPNISEWDWSEKGRVAANNNEEWTPEMEAAEQARLKAEYDAA